MPPHMDADWVLQCRPGFEPECAAEVEDRVRDARAAVAGSGVVTVRAAALPPLAELVFSRQAFRQAAELTLPAGERIDAILAALAPHAGPVNYILLEHPDDEAGKELAGFLRKFTPPLLSALTKGGFPRQPDAGRRMHVLFSDSRHVRLGFSTGGEGSPLLNGILRLKLPREAPSRSTLKLEEALQVFLDERERAAHLRPGLTAVDLGAAPGGWTWQMVQRHIRVTAVDNGPMQPALLDSGLVEHRREDGFRYRPPKPVEWLLCDMVEQPRRIAALMGDWLLRGECRRALFNLKLPMKQRYPGLRECLDGLRKRLDEAGLGYSLRCKQLYHDREEVTVYLALD